MYLASAFHAYVHRAIEGYIQSIHFICQQANDELRVGNTHDMFMHPNKLASCAINQVPGFHGNNSGGACDKSVSKSDNEHGAMHTNVLARSR